MNKDQAYHQIALACLKTLRSGKAASNEDTAKSLYDAIDNAFEQQFSLVLTELEDNRTRLNAIAQLDPERHTLADAQSIANNHGTAH